MVSRSDCVVVCVMASLRFKGAGGRSPSLHRYGTNLLEAMFHRSRDALQWAIVRPFCVCAASVLSIAFLQGQREQPRYVERVDVERVLVDARVLDSQGQAMVGLVADDFRVRIGGKPVAIESAMWVGGATATPAYVAELPEPSRVNDERL